MKTLAEIDSLYQSTMSKLPKKARTEYCESLIDKAQLNLDRNKKHLTQELKNKLYALILAAQAELNQLMKE